MTKYLLNNLIFNIIKKKKEETQYYGLLSPYTPLDELHDSGRVFM